jgi:hypothetical protein
MILHYQVKYSNFNNLSFDISENEYKQNFFPVFDIPDVCFKPINCPTMHGFEIASFEWGASATGTRSWGPAPDIPKMKRYVPSLGAVDSEKIDNNNIKNNQAPGGVV